MVNLGASAGGRRRVGAVIAALCVLGLAAGLWMRRGRAADPPTMEEAVEQFTLRQDALALRLFRRLDALEEGALPEEHRLLALFGQGLTLAHQTNPDMEAARRLWERILQRAPDHPVALRARLAIARSYDLQHFRREEDARDARARARALYGELMERHPGTEAAFQAHLRLGMSRIQEMTPEAAAEGAALLESWAEEREGHPLVGAVYSILGRAYLYPIGDSAAALRAMLRADRAGLISYSLRTDLHYRIADVAQYDLGDYDTARAYYRKIIEHSPQDSRAYIARLRLEEIAGREDSSP